MALRLPDGSRNALVDVLVDRVDAGAGAGTIKLYTGTQPASANDAAVGTLLATFTCADPAFGSASSGSATIQGVPLAAVGATNGTAGWFRVADSTGATVFDGSAGGTGSGAQLELSTTAITGGGNVEITGGTVAMPAG